VKPAHLQSLPGGRNGVADSAAPAASERQLAPPRSLAAPETAFAESHAASMPFRTSRTPRRLEMRKYPVGKRRQPACDARAFASDALSLREGVEIARPAQVESSLRRGDARASQVLVREGGISQAGLKITDDRAKEPRRENSWPERTGRILTDRRQLLQSGSGRRGHADTLPVDLLFDRVRPFGGGQTGCLGGIRGGAQGVRAHMGNGGGLASRSGGGRRCGSLHVTSGAGRGKSAADLFGDAKLATSKGPRPGDRVTGAAIPRNFRLEQSQHPFGAIGRPHRDDPPVSFAQRLRRPHDSHSAALLHLGPQGGARPRRDPVHLVRGRRHATGVRAAPGARRRVHAGAHGDGPGDDAGLRRHLRKPDPDRAARLTFEPALGERRTAPMKFRV
jgi:hypothetical protein